MKPQVYGWVLSGIKTKIDGKVRLPFTTTAYLFSFIKLFLTSCSPAELVSASSDVANVNIF